MTATPNSVANISTLVQRGLADELSPDRLIAPSKLTLDPTRLAESGVRIPGGDAASYALVTLGTSSNGLVENTGDAFDGALQGSLVTTQFNGNVTLLYLNATRDAVEPLFGPGSDGWLGTTDDVLVDANCVFPIATGQSQPLDVTLGRDGGVWFAEFGADKIRVLAPSDLPLPNDSDFDNDGLRSRQRQIHDRFQWRRCRCRIVYPMAMRWQHRMTANSCSMPE